MALSNLGRRLLVEVNKEVQEIQQKLGQGQLSNFEEYRFYTGKIQGMMAVLDILDKLEGSD